MPSRREPSSHVRRAGAPAHQALPSANARTARGADQDSVPKGASAAQCAAVAPRAPSREARRQGSQRRTSDVCGGPLCCVLTKVITKRNY
eukprot:scaffold39283_cov63-Phaeocystis_antarctica.AAC.3